MKTRLLARFPAYPRSDEMDLQIRFDSWVRHFPHIKEKYDSNRLIIKLDDEDNFLVEARMSDKQWTLWPAIPQHACGQLDKRIVK